MRIEDSLKKDPHSPLLSWAWALAGTAVFLCVHHAWFAPLFLERFQSDPAPIRPLLLGACAGWLAVCRILIAGRRLPHGNGVEALPAVVLSVVAALSVFLIAAGTFHSWTYLLALSIFQIAWFGAEIHFRNRFAARRYVVFPVAPPLSARDFPGCAIVLPGAAGIPGRRDADAVVVDPGVDLDPACRPLLAEYRRAGVPIISPAQFLENELGRVPAPPRPEDAASADAPPRLYPLLKPGVEKALALIGLLVALPVFLVAAAAVKLARQGSVFFLQERVGLHGKPFTIYKLRTMREADGAVTRVGAFLRKHHIDELPQLVNVLKGDMALVGPRPETVELAALYGRSIPGYSLRTRALPGVASWALLHQGNVSGVEATRVKLSYDLFYLKHISCLLDFHILSRAIWIMAAGRETPRSPVASGVVHEKARNRT